MGFRFRRSLRLAPGLRVNLSKRGASLSVGKPGATVNIGPSGTRETIGLPGTGLSYHTTPSGSGTNVIGKVAFWIMQVVYLALAIIFGYFAISVFWTLIPHHP